MDLKLPKGLKIIMKYIGLDLGSVTCGISKSDTGFIANPVKTIRFHPEDYDMCMELLLEYLEKEKPDLIISAGAAAAVPFFYLGKLFGAKLVYIEVYDRIDKATLTGRLVYPIADKFIVQWEEQKGVYPKAENFGSIF